MVGYQGESPRSRSQRHSASRFRATQTGRPSAPARWAIDVSQVIPVLQKGGYEGAIATEYEGQRMVQDVYPFSSVEMVRRHQVMLRRLLGEI